MNVQNLYSPYDLELLEIHNYEAKPHKNTFFEMVFVLDGSGFQIINDHQLPYAPDKLFLIFPQDKHSFQIDFLAAFFSSGLIMTILKHKTARTSVNWNIFLIATTTCRDAFSKLLTTNH